MNQMVELTVDRRGVARVIMNRPEVHNAFNAEMIAALSDAFRNVAARQDVRVMVLAAAGKSFSAGADANWMQSFAAMTHAENMADAGELAAMLDLLNRLPKPTIAAVNGAAFGGGVGLVACCDLAVAVESAVFSLSEVRLGLIPATISPYVLAAIGARQARRWFTTGERFLAARAREIGLVHELVSDGAALDAAVERLIGSYLANGPEAVTAAKDLVFAVTNRPQDHDLMQETARRIADRRVSAEGQEGLAAFLAKRKPHWVRED